MLITFLSLILAVAVMRLFELRISVRHRRRLFERGASAVPDPGFAAMVALHIAILCCSVLEVLLLERRAPAWFAASMVLGVVVANVIRISAITALGEHWNVRVVDSTQFGVVTRGPYRWTRHPNYLAVFLELLCLPLVHGAWLTALCGGALHVLVLHRRISIEERALLANPAYREAMADKPRWLPRWSTGRRPSGRGHA